MPKPTTGTSRTTIPDLVCPRCGSRLVQPLEIDSYGVDRWQLRVGCPDCDWTDAGVFTTEEIEEIEEEFDRGYDLVVAAFAELVQVNMADYVDRFVSALAVDAIRPMDF